MKELVAKLFTPRDEELITNLYLGGTPRDQLLIRAEVAKRAEDCPVILAESGTDWILCVLSKADQPPRETLRVLQAVAHLLVAANWTFEGLTHRGNGTECSIRELPTVADDCLIATSLFTDYLEHHAARTGAPNTQHYAKLGQLALKATDYGEVADHWDFWVDFLGTEFSIGPALPN